MEYWFIYLVPGVLAVIWLAVQFAARIPGLWQSTDRFNSTTNWTPVSPHGQPHFPPLTSGLERGLGIITPRLDAGETLEGFAFAFFAPPRPRDWGFSRGPSVVIAVTPRRILLFELKSYPQVVTSSCFIEYDDIQFLHPPKPGFLGTSSRLRFGLFSGHEYQLSFLGPFPYPEFLRQEQRMAAYLRSLAPRLRSSRAPHGVEPEYGAARAAGS